MTVYELVTLLQQYPEDAEILIYDNTLNWHNVLSDRIRPELEHDEDGTPLLYLQTD